jgi:hypothetical protein
MLLSEDIPLLAGSELFMVVLPVVFVISNF